MKGHPEEREPVTEPVTEPAKEPSNEMDRIVRERRVVVCVGSGGVGKTTISAVIALHAALSGKRVLVLTIDPARRLANSLGIEHLDDTAREIDLTRFRKEGGSQEGHLFAMMLDMKQAFDRLVERHSPDAETRQRILNNRFYGFFSTSLAGTQEYSAMERLRELYLETDYDLIVLDTPPTAHALDFLDAPRRLFDALDSSAIQWLARPSKFSFNFFRIGGSYLLKGLSKFTGGGFLEELSEFLNSFDALWGGFKERAAETRAIMGGDDIAFYIITSPNSATLKEALFFFKKLEEEDMQIGGIVVNRVHERFVPRPVLKAPIAELSRRLREVAEHTSKSSPSKHIALESLDWDRLSSTLLENAGEFHTLAQQDELVLEKLEMRLKHPLHRVPFFSADIHSLEGLEKIRQALFDLSEQRRDLTPGRF